MTTLGYKHSEETRAKMSASNKGKHGGTRSEETRRRLSESRRRYIALHGSVKLGPCSEETKQKISKANKGKHHTEEAKKKISSAAKGKRLSEETKAKMREKRASTHKKDCKCCICKGIRGEAKEVRKKSIIVGIRKRITLEERYGIEKASLIRKKLSLARKKRNPLVNKKQGETLRIRRLKLGGLNHKPECSCCICKAKRGETTGEYNNFYGKHHNKETLKRIGLKIKASYSSGIHKGSSQENIKNRLQKSLEARQSGPTSYEKKIIDLIKEYNLPYKFVGNGAFWITSEGKHINPDFIDTNGRKVAIEVFSDVFKKMTYGCPVKYMIWRKRLFLNFGIKVVFIRGKDLKRSDWKNHCLQLIA